MTDSHSELVAAARHLVQWGRARQTVWQDASRDLLAALGNRYASFDDLQPVPPPPPLPPTPRPQPLIPPEVLAPVPLPLPVPVPAAIAGAAVAAPEKSPVRAPARAPQTGRRGLAPGRIILAAVIVLAAVASPSLWRAYEASRVVAPTTNRLTIETTPPGSTVLIDGIESGKTPLSTSLILGVHRVELRYRKNVRTIDIDVIAGDPLVTRVDWTKRPPARKRAPATNTAARRLPPAAKPSAADPAASEGHATAPPLEIVAPAASERPADEGDSPAPPSGATTNAADSPAAADRP